MMATTRPCPSCGAAALENAEHCGNCGRPLPPGAPAAKPAGGGLAKTMFGYAAPKTPGQSPSGSVPAQPSPPPPAATPPAATPPAQPPPPAYGAPPQQPPPAYGAPPQQPPPAYGAPPQQPPPAYPPAQGGYPPPAYPPQPGYGAPAYGASIPGQMGTGSPGILGISIDRFRDPGFQKKALMVAGIAILFGMIMPLYVLNQMVFGWQSSFITGEGSIFTGLLLPLFAGASCLVLALVPDLKRQLPPLVTTAVPLAVAVLAIALMGLGGIARASTLMSLAGWGYPILVAGLVCRLAYRGDVWPRYVIGVGGLLTAPVLFSALAEIGDAFGQSIFSGLAVLLVLALGVLAIFCLTFVPTPDQVPQLASLDRQAPLATTGVILWLPVFFFFFALVFIKMSIVLSFTALLHSVPMVAGYLLVIVALAPDTYAHTKAALNK